MPTTKTSSKSTSSKTAAKPTGKEVKEKETAKAAAPKARDSKVEVKPEAKSASKIAAAAPKKDERTSKADIPVKKNEELAKKPEAAKGRDSEDRATTGHNEPATMPKIAAAAPASEPERPSITTTMSKPQLARFRKLLEEKRDDIIKKAKETLEEDMTLDTNDLPDEMDLASSEYLQSFTFRLRGREKSFLDKINKALERIDNGTFGVCEECGDEISVKRLEARPETTLCIRCKEDQERAEKDYG